MSEDRIHGRNQRGEVKRLNDVGGGTAFEADGSFPFLSTGGQQYHRNCCRCRVRFEVLEHSDAPLALKPTPPVVKPAPAPAAGADQRRTRETRQQNSRPERPPRRRQTAASRYHEVLPRWMREGQQNGGRNGDKRRKR